MDRDDPDHPMYGRNPLLENLERRGKVFSRVHPSGGVVCAVSYDLNALLAKDNQMPMYMNFGMALDALKRGSKVQREGWNGKDMVVILVKTEQSNPVRPYFHLHKPSGEVESWNPSTPDCLAEDWQIVN